MRSPELDPGGIVAYAPGSIGNLGPGLDVLGCALTGAGDEVHAWWVEDPGVHIFDPGLPELPAEPTRHACGIAALAVLSRVSVGHRGIALSVRKGLPLSAGQGGSGASAIAAAVAVNSLLATSGFDSLDSVGLLRAGMESESRLAGTHLDNLAASLLGGVVCVRGIDPPDVSRIPVNVPIWFALAHPSLLLRTKDARAVLPEFVPRATVIAQIANVAAIVNALGTGDLALLGRALVDHVAEPVRAALVPGFAAAKQAAIESGAIGASFSGSGPTTFAICDSEANAIASAEAMRWAYESSGTSCSARVAMIDMQGARWRAAS